MNAPDTSNPQNDSISEVLEIIRKIAEKSAGGDYIYRGEPDECFEKVSSSLYRQYNDIETEHFDIEMVQKEILNEAKKYTHEKDEFEILTELQHFGGKTNLIDFTTDYLIALFFACDGSHGKNGRMILQKREPVEKHINQPRNPRNRVIAQKSLFVRPPQGFLEPDKVIPIPKHLKRPILEHLRKYHGLSTQTIYNDLQGFIKHQDIYQSAYTEFYKGLTCQEMEDYDKAIGHYTKAIELNPDYTGAYNNRGNAYGNIGEYDKAIQDYDKAVARRPNYAKAYYNRGLAYARKGEHDRAIVDFDKAIELEPDYAEAYKNRGIAYGQKGEYIHAFANFNKAIELNPNDADAYYSRGITYYRKGEHDRAILDFNKTIELKPDYAEVYTNRGKAWLHQKEWEKARSDLIFARERGVDIIASFHNDYESVADFEQKNGITLPQDLAAMLTRQQA